MNDYGLWTKTYTQVQLPEEELIKYRVHNNTARLIYGQAGNPSSLNTTLVSIFNALLNEVVRAEQDRDWLRSRKKHDHTKRESIIRKTLNTIGKNLAGNFFELIVSCNIKANEQSTECP